MTVHHTAPGVAPHDRRHTVLRLGGLLVAMLLFDYLLFRLSYMVWYRLYGAEEVGAGEECALWTARTPAFWAIMAIAFAVSFAAFFGTRHRLRSALWILPTLVVTTPLLTVMASMATHQETH